MAHQISSSIRRRAEHLTGALPATSGAPIRVRPATAKDRGRVRRIECACFGRARFLFGLWPRTGSRDALTWVAESGGRPAGYLIAYDHELDGRLIAYVGGVGVLPEFRQQGIGTRLMNALRAGRRPVWLHVRAGNTAAVSMYLKYGMRELRREARFYSDGEDALVMVTPDVVQGLEAFERLTQAA